MKLLKHIGDEPLPENKKYKKRTAARAVLFDENGLIPILYVSRYDYHKLPGGGIEGKENINIALAREIKEEVGAEAKITGEVGEITEYRSKWNLLQTSLCFLGKITAKGSQSYTKKEKKEGFNLIWLDLDAAIDKTRSDKPKNYEGEFIQKRDLKFLEEAKNLLEN